MTLRTGLGYALHRVPDSVRRVLPRSVRDGVRHRIGPFAPWEAGFIHTAPPPPAPGQAIGPPDFVGIGVQKAGTTWWFGLLAAHPDVFHRPEVHKERHFFARFATQGFGPGDVRDYHGWFPRPPGARTGEWTPDYLAQPWVPPLLHQAAPEARLVVVLRNPIERFLSGLAHAGVHPASQLGDLETDALGRGFYAASLTPWTEQFSPDRLLVLQYERCVADPTGQLARTYRFLGLDERFHPPDLRRSESPTRGAKPTLDVEARRRLTGIYAADVERLAAVVPGFDFDLGLWPDFAR